MPTPEDFLFVVFPDEDTEAFDEPMIYERGEVRPLLPSDSSWSTSEARTEESTLTDEEPQPSPDDSAEQNSDEPEDDEASTDDADQSSSIADAVSRLTGRD
ncbi:hypothetical protein HAPAU_36990 [Halalkalicoccus paucihalophilus]|uniref:Uncharacterized protein n=1 Tax=Halalkalicoccus paucihalophilus TaxID=1008153 RepID=A0A151A947_9EURY|nr:hypothetical protein [Halalkalicoccus paucihalophilus]KYH24228.1 hypothetical protein HAPAU_36990 [Halalkalicoccus paucihalophilus]